MFSERWICFCCPHTHKHRRSIAPTEQPQPIQPSQSIRPPQSIQVRPSSRNRVKKKSDVSKFLFTFLKKILFIFFIALASVVIIQSWFRKRQAILERRRKAAWTIYQNIEYAGEQDQLKVLTYFIFIIIFLYSNSSIISFWILCKLYKKILVMFLLLLKYYAVFQVYQEQV